MQEIRRCIKAKWGSNNGRKNNCFTIIIFNVWITIVSEENKINGSLINNNVQAPLKQTAFDDKTNKQKNNVEQLQTRNLKNGYEKWK